MELSLLLLGATFGAGAIVASRFLPKAGQGTVPLATPALELGKAMRAFAAGETHVRLQPAATGEQLHLATSFNAMAEAVEQREAALRTSALTDGETKMLTRQALAGAVAKVRAMRDTPLFVAAVRIERFFTLRQNIGYTVAAGALRELGARASRAIPGAQVGRLGTATIGIGFPAADLAEARAWLDALRFSLAKPLDLGDHCLDVGADIGLAWSEDNSLSASELLARAELAADQAEGTRGRLSVFSVDAFGDPSERLGLMRDLRGALSNGDIFLCYQPKFRSRTDEIDAIEALIRWRHPTRGMIPPDQFIALAEEMGEIRAVTEWVLRQAAVDQAALASRGLPLAVYINISGRLLGDSKFAASALALARDFVGQVGFEITETSVIFDPDGALRDLTAYAAAGIRIAIDDYGSGWSSLAYLKKLPAHELKIDRLFIMDLPSSHRDPLLVRSTIDLAHALGLEVTAEGVDSPASLALLRVMGCDVIQGFLIAKPMTVGDLEVFLGEGQYRNAVAIKSPILSQAVNYW